MHKKWYDDAWVEYLAWQDKDKKVLKKINTLLKDIDRNGYNCTGHPEPLIGDLAGFYNKKNRIVFRIVNDELEIVQCGSHYGDR